MKNLLYIFILAASIALSSCAPSLQQSSQPGRNGSGLNGNVKFLVPWGNGKVTVQSLIEEIDSAGYRLRNLAFYRDSIKESSLLFSQTSRDYAVVLMPLKDNAGNMMVIWQSGVAYHFSIYSFNDDKITKVLEASSPMYPELIYEKKDSENLSILVTNVDLVNNRKTKEKNIQPVSATLYRWDGTQYKSVPNISWTKRFSSAK